MLSLVTVPEVDLLGEARIATVPDGRFETVPDAVAPPGQALPASTMSPGRRETEWFAVTTMVSDEPEISPEALRTASHTDVSVSESDGFCPQV